MKDKEIKILAEKQAQENISKKNHFSTCISLRKRVPELDSTTTSSAAPSLLLGIEGREGGREVDNENNTIETSTNIVTQEIENIEVEDNVLSQMAENSSSVNENNCNLISNHINEGIDLQIQSVRIETTDVIEMEVQRNRDDIDVDVDAVRSFLSEGESSGNIQVVRESEIMSSGGMLISSEANSHRLSEISEGNQRRVTDRDMTDNVDVDVDGNSSNHDRNIDVCLTDPSERSPLVPLVQSSSVMTSSLAIDRSELQVSRPASASASATAISSTVTINLQDSVKSEIKKEIDETGDDSFSSLNLQYLSFMSFPFVLSSSSKAAVLECDAALQMRRGRHSV